MTLHACSVRTDGHPWLIRSPKYGLGSLSEKTFPEFPSIRLTETFTSESGSDQARDREGQPAFMHLGYVEVRYFPLANSALAYSTVLSLHVGKNGTIPGDIPILFGTPNLVPEDSSQTKATLLEF